MAGDRYLRHVGAAAGRGVYQQATEAGRIIDQTRQAIARFLGAADSNHIVFTANGSDSLNLAIHGLLRPGDHVISTAAEHNSVLRPLRNCQDKLGVDVSYVSCDSSGQIDPDDILAELRPKTRLVAMLHASNVTGVIQPVSEVGQICRQHGVFFLLDAAQSLGHLPINVNEIHADLLAASGHKGLLGPLGTGLLYLRQGIEDQLHAIRQGGTGSSSESDLQPQSLPDKYETGNLNVAAIAGLAAGIQWLEQQTIPKIREHELALTQQLRAGLRQIQSVTVHGPEASNASVGVVSISIEGYDPQEAAAALDSAFHVQVRAGLHCAPRIHQAIGTFDRGGTVRFSIGPFNTTDDIEIAVQAVREIT